MVFSSLYFTFLFLPIVIILYFIAKEKYRNIILLIASLYFYSYGEPKFILIMLGSIIVNYGLALAISTLKTKENESMTKWILVIDIVLNLGLLFVFKYLNFSVSIITSVTKHDIQWNEIALPIGISFFTFQALSYVVDVYRGSVEVQKNILYLALYISFFPQLIAGPIVRYSTIEAQIENRKTDLNGFAEGTRRFLLGFSKKVILANNLAVLAEEIFAMDVKQVNPLILWIGSIAFSLQIFFDFSGYSDMAIGLGRIFGFQFEENFDYPYISKSITEFWRRWHISLGQWFRDYVYIPLGGSRVSIPRHIINMLIVWLLTGIWHGANFTFIAWGIGYFILLVIEKYVVRPEKRKSIVVISLWQVITLVCVNFGWVVFNSTDLISGIRYCLAMLGRYNIKPSVDAYLLRYIREYGAFILMGLLFSTPIMKYIKSKLEKGKMATVFAVIEPVGYGCIFLWAVSYIILGAHNPFIYFNF